MIDQEIVDSAVTTKLREVKVGDRVLVVRAGNDVTRATRSAAPHASIATVVEVAKPKPLDAHAALADWLTVRLDEGQFTMPSRYSLLVLPPIEDHDEATARLAHGIALLRHGAALVAPEIDWLPEDSMTRTSLHHTIQSIGLLVGHFENAYDDLSKITRGTT